MKGTCVILFPTGKEMTKEFDHVPTLDEMREAIGGGYIQFVPYFETFRGIECVAICDEEGKLKRQPINKKATEHWHQQIRTDDVLTGIVAVYYGDDEFFAGVTS